MLKATPSWARNTIRSSVVASHQTCSRARAEALPAGTTARTWRAHRPSPAASTARISRSAADRAAIGGSDQALPSCENASRRSVSTSDRRAPSRLTETAWIGNRTPRSTTSVSDSPARSGSAGPPAAGAGGAPSTVRVISRGAARSTRSSIRSAASAMRCTRSPLCRSAGGVTPGPIA